MKCIIRTVRNERCGLSASSPPPVSVVEELQDAAAPQTLSHLIHALAAAALLRLTSHVDDESWAPRALLIVPG